MVKERKAQMGCSNLSARSDKSDTLSPAAANGTVSGVPAFYRSWTHKLVSPDEYTMKDPNLTNARTIKLTATWQPKDVAERSFDTVHSSSYINPKDMPVRNRVTHTMKEIDELNENREVQRQSVDNLCRVARKMYGTSQAMMKKFNKKNTDDISVEELGKYMKRNQLDTYCNEEDRRNIFDFIDPENKGSIPVSTLLKTLEEEEFHESEHTKEMMRIREYLATHVDKHRETVQGTTDPHFETIKEKKGVHNETHLMKLALSTKTFDLDITSDELQEVIQGLFEQYPNDESHRKFARFLKVSNLNLSTIPFYDIRCENLDNLKHKAAVIEQRCHDEERQNKLEELTKTMRRGHLTVSSSVLPGMSQSQTLTRTNSGSNNRYGSENLNTSAFGSSSHDSHQHQHKGLSVSASMPELPSNKAALSPLLDRGKSPKNLAASARGTEIETNSLHSNETNSASGSPLKAIRASRLKDDLFNSLNQTSASDFYTQIVESGASMGRMKDSSKVLRVEKIDPGVYKEGGRRSVAVGPTDWTRVGVGGERAPGEGYGTTTLEEDNSFRTMNSSFYTPIIYEPSQPAMRPGKSETQLNVEKRDYRRKQRAERTQANMQFTRDRLEHEIMEKEVQKMRNDHSKMISNIRYETAMFLNDLAKFKQQPLQRMNKKPNLLLSDRMWGGSFDKQTVVQVPEGRDFNSTYNDSYQSSALRTTGDLNASVDSIGH